jgi:peroxiredoxin
VKKITIVVLALAALGLGIWVNVGLKEDFTTLDGQKRSWASLQEQWVVVNYFAEWCAPCLKEIPELNHFYLQQHPDIQLYAVSFDPLSDADLKAVQDKYDMKFPLINQLYSMPWQQKPQSLPTTYIIGPDGKVKRQLKGEQSSEKLLQTIDILKGL